MPDLTNEIDRIETLYKAATAGEWQEGLRIATVTYVNTKRGRECVAKCDAHRQAEDAALIVALKNAWPALRDQLRRQGEIIKSLPVTADGVPVVDGMNVWHCLYHSWKAKDGSRVPMEPIVANMPRPYCVGARCWSDGCQSDDGGGTHLNWDECYATREAAEAAFAAKGAKP